MSDISQIDFDQSTELTKAVRSIYDPDKDLTPSSALTYVKLEQFKTEVWLTSYVQAKGIFCRKIAGSGVEGTTYIFDGEDFLTRITEKLEVWKINGLRLRKTNSNRMKVQCVIPGSKLTNNLMVGTYNGDEADFDERIEKLLCGDTLKLGRIPKERVLFFWKCVKILDSFSALRADTQERAVWLWCIEGELYLTATEKNSSQGVIMLMLEVGSVECGDLGLNWNLGLRGRHLTRSNYISSFYYDIEENRSTTSDLNITVFSKSCTEGLTEEIKLELDSNARIELEGNGGLVNLPLVDGFACRALSVGAKSYFFESDKHQQVDSYRIFFLKDLIFAMELCTPKKGATRNDVVIEFIQKEDDLNQRGEIAIAYKRSDSRKVDKDGMAEFLTATTDGIESEWSPIVVDHSYFVDCLNTLKSFHTLREKTDPKFFVGDLAEEEESFEFVVDEKQTDILVKITQCRNKKREDHRFCLLELARVPGCVLRLMTQTKERTKDYEQE
jgi:hypothetical protein